MRVIPSIHVFHTLTTQGISLYRSLHKPGFSIFQGIFNLNPTPLDIPHTASYPDISLLKIMDTLSARQAKHLRRRLFLICNIHSPLEKVFVAEHSHPLFQTNTVQKTHPLGWHIHNIGNINKCFNLLFSSVWNPIQHSTK